MSSIKGAAALADALAVIARSSTAIESKANAVLAILKTSGISDEKNFRAAVREAYAVNGWHTAAGRPAEGVKKASVPPTVKQYVSFQGRVHGEKGRVVLPLRSQGRPVGRPFFMVCVSKQ